MTEHDSLLRAKLNQDSGKLTWREMQPHFARGSVIRVASDLDLIEVATAMAGDGAGLFSNWLQERRVGRATEDEAKDWNERAPLFWAVVVAPWVLVQEIHSDTARRNHT